jgi:hypothetical protein
LHITTARESDSVMRVSESTDQLPTDIEVLQARLAMVLAERDAAIAERDQALSQNDRLGPRREAPRQSRRTSGRSAARSCNDCARRYRLSLLSGADACDPGAVPGDRDAPSQICLPGL